MLTKLKLSRPLVGDLHAVANASSDVEQEIALFARLSGLVPKNVDLLDFADYQAMQDWFRAAQGQEKRRILSATYSVRGGYGLVVRLDDTCN